MSSKSGTGASLTVPPQGTFSIGAFGEKIETETRFMILSPGGSQTVVLHTSCSKRIFVGDRFGALQVIGFNGQSFGTNCQHFGTGGSSGSTGVDNSVAGCCYAFAASSTAPGSFV